jgi:uncharacterized lipoprotein YddW (UPF0748 family)
MDSFIFQHFLTYLILVILLLITTTAGVFAGKYEVLKHYKTGKPVNYAGRFSNSRIKIPKNYKIRKNDLRGAWVATVANIDFQKHKNSSSFKKEYLEVVKNLSKNGFNTVVFQIRPTNDAFYRSKLNPWSRYLTGKEGEGISGFDPLKYMAKEAHNHKLKFHAWLNPYRVIGSTPMRKSDFLKTLSPGNFAVKNPELVLEIPLNNGNYQLILNPGRPEVISFIIDTVKEIVQNYDIDAIHFDDYFYPYHNIGNVDKETFTNHNPQKLSLGGWRRENVNSVIKGIKDYLSEYEQKNNKSVEFGISPFGIWANKSQNPEGSLTKGIQSYYSQYADTRKWVKENWIDYIVPQLYWEFNHDVAAYATLVDWWVDLTRKSKVKLYIGNSASRLGSKGAWRSPDELDDQLRYNSKYKTIKGTVFFSYTNLFFPKNKIMKRGVKKVLDRYRSN